MITIMRNSFKLGLIALVITAPISSCGDGGKTTGSSKTPVYTASKTIDSAKKATIDSVKKDSVKIAINDVLFRVTG
jgi:hypothetical protein